MIREFLSRRRLIFFPKSWANSVSQWICGVHSPSGTLKIVNTANPSKGKSASFDVDIDAVWNRLRDRIDAIRREDDGQKLRDSKDETFGDKIQNGSTEDLTHDDIADWDEAVENSFVSSDSYGTISDSIGEIADIVDGILTDYLSADDIGVAVAEENHTHTTEEIDDWGTATANFLTDTDMSDYALDADLALLEQDVADIAEEIIDINDDLDTICDDIYDSNGGIRFVTLDTDQNTDNNCITGAKQFTKTITVKSANGTTTFDGRVVKIMHSSSTNVSALVLALANGSTGVQFDIDESSNRATIRSYATGEFRLQSAMTNGVKLQASPSFSDLTALTSAEKRTVATCGWVNENFVTMPNGKTPFTGKKKTITNVSWDGTVLKYSSVNREYVKGILVGEESNTDTVIDTPVVFSPT